MRSRNDICVLALTALLLCGATAFFSASAWSFDLVEPKYTADTTFRWESYRGQTSKDGLPQNTVNAMAQGTDGFVYAGTNRGLARYDGHSWREVPLPSNASGARISSLVANGDGSLWIAVEGVGLLRYMPGKAASLLFDAKTKEDVEALAIGSGGGVLAGTSRSLYDCDEQACKEIVAARGIPIASLLLGRGPSGKCVWVGTYNRGLYRLDLDDESTPAVYRLADWHMGHEDGLPNLIVTALAQWGGPENRDLWIGTGRGLARLSGDRVTTYSVPRNAVIALLPGRNREGTEVLHASFDAEGLVEIHPDGTWVRRSERQGLPEDYVLSLLLTDVDLVEPTLWIGTKDSGVIRFEPNSWSVVAETAGLPGHAIYGMGESTFLDGTRDLWVSTTRGSVRWNHGGWEPLLPPPFAEWKVAFVVHGQDELFIGGDRGVIRISRTDTKIYDPLNSKIPGFIVEAMDYDENGPEAGTLWIGTHHGLASLYKGAMRSMPVPVLGDEPSITSFSRIHLEGTETQLWAGSNHGLVYRQDGAWRLLPRSCLVDSKIADLHEIGKPGRNHALLVAYDQGLMRVDLDHQMHCDKIDLAAVDAKSLHQIQVDSLNRIYLFGEKGISRLTPAGAGSPTLFSIEQFTLEDGLPTLEFGKGSFVDDTGRIWGGSIEGAAIYDTSSEIRRTKPRNLRLLSAGVEGSDVALTPGLSLEASSSPFFDFSLLSYQREQKTRYRSELLGFPGSASEWTSIPTRTFTRLPAGNYSFVVHGRDGFGNEAEPVSLSFSVQLPLWRRPWAMALYALMLVGIGVLLGFLRTRALARRTNELQRQVDARTALLAQAKTEAEMLQRRAEETRDAKSMFLAHISHEIRTPMNAILGLAYLALRSPLTNELYGYLERIHGAASGLMAIVNDVLDSTKIEFGKLQLEHSSFDLREVLREALQTATAKAEQKGLRCKLDIDRTIPKTLIGDSLRLKQVLLNIVSNAVKFTERGEISVEIRVLSFGNDSLRLLFLVSDTGIGMSAEQVGRLFEPFVQGDASTTRRFGGTGLGLSIAKRLVELMGGTIAVESALGHGSRFGFQLQFGIAQEQISPKHGDEYHALSNTRFPEITVLIVDDNPINQQIVQELLEAAGARTVLANTGREAVQRVKAMGPAALDLILMDVYMPEMDGLDATRSIRDDAKFSRLPIVALTASVTREDFSRCIEAGMNDCMSKPVDPDLLYAKVHRWTRTRLVSEVLQKEQGGSPEGVDAVLEALREYLAAYDTQAVAYLKTHESELAQSFRSDSVRRIVHLVCEYRYDEALAELDFMEGDSLT